MKEKTEIKEKTCLYCFYGCDWKAVTLKGPLSKQYAYYTDAAGYCRKIRAIITEPVEYGNVIGSTVACEHFAATPGTEHWFD